jgi:hypothetical protein
MGQKEGGNSGDGDNTLGVWYLFMPQLGFVLENSAALRNI